MGFDKLRAGPAGSRPPQHANSGRAGDPGALLTPAKRLKLDTRSLGMTLGGGRNRFMSNFDQVAPFVGQYRNECESASAPVVRCESDSAPVVRLLVVLPKTRDYAVRRLVVSQ